MTLNTRTPPFDDVRVRRALNFAVDRKLLAKIFAGIGSSTCQVFPPNFPGYVPYCPFTRHPDGTWTAPDLAAGTQARPCSGTAGSNVTVWATPDYAFGIPVPVGRYFVRVLRGLGYRATLRVVGIEERLLCRHPRPRPARPDGVRRLGQRLSRWSRGSSFRSSRAPRRKAAGASSAIRRLERRISEAARLQISDLAAAHRRWTSIEHDDYGRRTVGAVGAPLLGELRVGAPRELPGQSTVGAAHRPDVGAVKRQQPPRQRRVRAASASRYPSSGHSQ